MSARRTWDKEFYEKKAKERLEYGDDYVDETDGAAQKKPDYVRQEFRPAEDSAAGPAGSQRAFIKSRDEKVELDDKVGKVTIINPTEADGIKAGYWCEVCKCLLKDSASYLDHINGKKHQRALGFSMRVERADVSDVKQRLADLKRKVSATPAPKISALEEYKQRQAAQDAEKEDFKRRRKDEAQAKRMAKATQEEEEEEGEDTMDPEIAAMLGFNGFATSKR